MYGTFWSLVPPVIAIVLALITKEAYSSLFIGAVVGALFACGFSPVASLNAIVKDGLIAEIAPAKPVGRVCYAFDEMTGILN